jgi:hypothetical protein
MQNYSDVFQATIDEFESPYVPGDRGDEGKGQVCARAGYKIHTTMSSATGYIAKSGGQTQYHGIAVDALTDCVDGSGADFLTDELQADGRRLIRVAYTPYATPPPGSPPPSNWVQPTEEYLTYGGPLVLKNHTAPPNPDVPPPSDPDVARFDAIDQQLARMETQQATDTAAIQQQIHDVIEDAEATLLIIAKLWLLMRRRNPPERGSHAGLMNELDAWLKTQRLSHE